MARNWNALSTAYRNRLQRAGITQAQYESGVSLAKARGHQNTPERPEDAQKNPKRYATYLNSRKALRDRVVKRKKEYFGKRPRFSEEHSRAYVWYGVDFLEGFDQRQPTIAEMKYVLKLTDAQLDAAVSAAARHVEQEYSFLFYH